MEAINLSVEHEGRRYHAKTEGLLLSTKSLLSSPVPYDGKFGQHRRTITISRNSSYQIQPHTITEGPMKGCQALVLVPTTALRFLDLPIEVRDMIYEFILSDGTTELKIFRPKHSPSKVVDVDYAPQTKAWKEGRQLIAGKWIDNDKRTPLSLLQANKQVYNEAFKVLYRSRAFSFQCAASLSRFFELNSACAEHVTHIVLTPCATSTASMDLIAKARPRSLQRLEIDHALFFRRASVSSKDAPAMLLKLFSPLLDAVYLARQRKGINVGIDQLLKRKHGDCIDFGECGGRKIEDQLAKLIKQEYPMK